MRIYTWCFCLLILATFSATAQTATLDDAMRLLKKGDLARSNPAFQQVFEKGTPAENQKAIIALSEYYIDHRSQFKEGQVNADLGNMLIRNANAIMQKHDKVNDDIYAIGVAYWAVIETGTYPSKSTKDVLQLVLQALNDAAHGGNKNASTYMAQALRRYKLYNSAVPYGDIFAWANQASIDKKSPRPLLEMVEDYTGMFWYAGADKGDTTKQLIISALNAISANQPDSFYVATDYMWQKVFKKNGQEKEMQDVLNGFYNNATNIPSMPLKKGVAWHYLYTYMYDHSQEDYSPQKQAEIRNNAWKKISNIYGNDKQQLLALLGEFSARSNGNLISDALGLNWLKQFSGQPVTNPKVFYTGAAASGQNLVPFLVKEAQPELYVDAVLKGYEKRQAKFLKIIGDEETMYKGYMGDTLRASIISNLLNDRIVLQKLMQLPAFANSTKAKYINANANFLYHHAFTNYEMAVTTDIEELPALISGWSAEEKKAYNLAYYKAMLNSVAFAYSFAAAIENKAIKIGNVDPFTGKPYTTTLYTGDKGGKQLKQMLDKLQAIFN